MATTRRFSLGAAILIVTFSLTRPLATAPQQTDDAAIRQTIEHYFRGHATGNGEEFKKAFAADAQLWSIQNGQLVRLPSADYIARASGKPAADEAQRKRSIASVDVTGNAAIVKVVLDYPATRFTDYMSLLKINGEWKIVNKTYVSQPKTAGAK